MKEKNTPKHARRISRSPLRIPARAANTRERSRTRARIRARAPRHARARARPSSRARAQTPCSRAGTVRTHTDADTHIHRPGPWPAPPAHSITHNNRAGRIVNSARKEAIARRITHNNRAGRIVDSTRKEASLGSEAGASRPSRPDLPPVRPPQFSACLGPRLLFLCV